MDFARGPSSSALLGETCRFLQGMLNASAAGVFWVERDLDLTVARLTGLSDEMSREYFDHFHIYDPLHHIGMAERHEQVAFGQLTPPEASADTKAIYSDFMCRYGFHDEVNFLLWQVERPFALVTLLKRDCDPPVQVNGFQWDAMHQHLEYMLMQHPSAQETRRQDILARQYRFTTREIEVLGLLEIGASNAKIADIMGIAVATVKTYVANILDKFGVESRFSAIAFARNL